MTRSARRWSLRAAAGAILFLALGGPAPGNVGGCGSTVVVADPQMSCADLETSKCLRDRQAGRIDDEQRNLCLGNVQARCSGFTWPVGCAPTEAQVDACEQVLLRADLLQETTEEIYENYAECRDLCPAADRP